MKSIVLTIIGFAIAIALLVGVVIPIANHGRDTGQTARSQQDSVDASAKALASPLP